MKAKTCLVTGAAGGIGAAISSRFADNGWKVLGTDLRPPKDMSVFSDFFEADLISVDNNELVDFVTRSGSLDSLVNNAAIQSDVSLGETSDEMWDRTFSVNLKRPFQLIRDLSALLADSGGSIVNVGSVHAVATSANVAAYAISKGALSSLTRYAALELAEIGVRCNAVLPGAVGTDMLIAGLSRRPHPDGPEGNLRQLIDRTPLGFLAEPDLIANMVFSLASDPAFAYMTGQCIVADGGASLRLSTE